MTVVGWIVSVLPSLGLIMSGIMKFTGAKELIEGMSKLGWDPKLAIPLGITELTCTILYLIPQTSVLGAILITGYMGGAIATHVRLGEGIVPHIIIGVLVWLGIFLRDPRLRAILPIRWPLAKTL
jgi:uncharacterized membrane protein YphA (DoxX/SURF4 family)